MEDLPMVGTVRRLGLYQYLYGKYTEASSDMLLDGSLSKYLGWDDARREEDGKQIAGRFDIMWQARYVSCTLSSGRFIRNPPLKQHDLGAACVIVPSKWTYSKHS
jgi:hypothetical protein